MKVNDWCAVLKISTPALESVVDHPEANTYALLLVALLERGAAMTLAEAAARFEEVGIADRSRALLSLQRCKPGRPPIYRDGDLYHLDPYDSETDLWAFRLGLLPSKVEKPAKVEHAPIPGPETPLDVDELDEGWTGASLTGWSAQRLVVAVLDAHGGPLTPEEVVAAVDERTEWYRLDTGSAKFKRRNSAVDVLPDGRWGIAEDADATIRQAREAVRDRVSIARRYRHDPGVVAKSVEAHKKRVAAHRAEQARMSRALLVAFPSDRPVAVALLDVEEHQVDTFVGDELAALEPRLAAYDVVGAVDVRGVLRALGFDAGARRLMELGPPQKTMTLNQRGRTLKITTELLVAGSCGISKPFGDAKKLAEYVDEDAQTKLRRRLVADVKSLYAFFEYGRLHGTVRLRWGFADEQLLAPWVHLDDSTLLDLKQSALELGVPLEVVVGNAPSWDEPWSRISVAHVAQGENAWDTWLVDEDGRLVNEADVQRARLARRVV